MRIALRQRLRPGLIYALLFILAWWMISMGVHASREFAMLFPLNWILLFPFGSDVIRWGAVHEFEFWWMIAHAMITVVGWMIAYYAVRGVYFRIRDAEGISMWMLWGIIIVCCIAFVVFLMRPAFEQIDLWWGAWPDGGVRGRI